MAKNEDDLFDEGKLEDDEKVDYDEEYDEEYDDEEEDDDLYIVDNDFVIDDGLELSESERLQKLYESTMVFKLLDPENNDPIFFFNEKGEEIYFDQVALLPIKEDPEGSATLYSLLKPQKPPKGEEDVIHIFTIDINPEKEEFALNYVVDKAIQNRVLEFLKEKVEQATANQSTTGDKQPATPVAPPKPPTPKPKTPLMKPPTPTTRPPMPKTRPEKPE